ncbi:MAG: response regulator [Myxococcota bacterium]
MATREDSMHALVVDDSGAVRKMLAKALTSLGFRVDEAADGREAMDRLAARPDVRLALVDWNMPVMDGFEVVRAVRANPALNGLRVMMVTSESEMDRVVSALDAGADEYLMKPFSGEMLTDKLAMMGFDVG